MRCSHYFRTRCQGPCFVDITGCDPVARTAAAPSQCLTLDSWTSLSRPLQVGQPRPFFIGSRPILPTIEDPLPPSRVPTRGGWAGIQLVVRAAQRSPRRILPSSVPSLASSGFCTWRWRAWRATYAHRLSFSMTYAGVLPEQVILHHHHHGKSLGTI